MTNPTFVYGLRGKKVPIGAQAVSLAAQQGAFRPVSTGQGNHFRRIPSAEAGAEIGASVMVGRWRSNGMENRNGSVWMITQAVGKLCGVTQDRRPLASWIIVLTTLSRATSKWPVIQT